MLENKEDYKKIVPVVIYDVDHSNEDIKNSGVIDVFKNAQCGIVCYFVKTPVENAQLIDFWKSELTHGENSLSQDQMRSVIFEGKITSDKDHLFEKMRYDVINGLIHRNIDRFRGRDILVFFALKDYTSEEVNNILYESVKDYKKVRDSFISYMESKNKKSKKVKSVSK